ncbi:MAG: PEGA domain-containing protein [archaeon]
MEKIQSDQNIDFILMRQIPQLQLGMNFIKTSRRSYSPLRYLGKCFYPIKSLIFILFTCEILFTQVVENNKNIAVLNFTSRGTTDIEAQVVSDRIRINLKQSGKLIIVERELVDKVLSEQKFQQSGCVESACMVEVGKMLAVKQIVGGSLSKMGNRYTIEAKLVDVSTGVIIENVTEDFSGPFEQLLSQKVPTISQRLLLSKNTQPVKKRDNMALLEFKARGLNETEVAIISDRIRIELKNTGAFNVLEREMMKRILEEQAFQQSGCTESECLVEAGQLLAVDKMVGGSISKVGNLFVIEARIVDIETGVIEHNVAEDFSGPIELLLVNVTKKVARRLAGLEVGGESTAPVFTGVADLIVESTPPGGVIYFDNAPLQNTTPYNVKNVPAGKHTVRVEKDELVAEKEIDLIQGRLNRVTLFLKEKTYTLLIYSTPSLAEIKVGNQVIGQTPIEYRFKKSSIPIQIVINKFGYLPYHRTIDLPLQVSNRLDVSLEQGGQININSNIEEADVFLNDRCIGTTPFTSALLKLGEYKVVVKKEYYQPIEKKVTLTKDILAVKIEADLHQLIGSLNILSNPGNPRITIDNLDFSNKREIQIPYGNHLVQITHPGYYPYREELLINTSIPISKEIYLEPKSRTGAIVLSTAIPGTGQIYYGSLKKGMLFTATACGLVYLIKENNKSFIKQWARYENDQIAYLNAISLNEIERTKKAMNSSYDQAIKYKRTTQIGFGIATVFWIYNVYDIYRLFKPIPGGNGAISISPSHNLIEFSMWIK